MFGLGLTPSVSLSIVRQFYITNLYSPVNDKHNSSQNWTVIRSQRNYEEKADTYNFAIIISRYYLKLYIHYITTVRTALRSPSNEQMTLFLLLLMEKVQAFHFVTLLEYEIIMKSQTYDYLYPNKNSIDSRGLSCKKILFEVISMQFIVEAFLSVLNLYYRIYEYMIVDHILLTYLFPDQLLQKTTFLKVCKCTEHLIFSSRGCVQCQVPVLFHNSSVRRR